MRMLVNLKDEDSKIWNIIFYDKGSWIYEFEISLFLCRVYFIFLIIGIWNILYVIKIVCRS